MNKSLFLFALSTGFLMIISSFTLTKENYEENVNEEIQLIKKSNGTRSLNSSVVLAFENNNQTSIYVENYTGSVAINISGTNEILQESIQVIESGQFTIDISSLPPGNYLLKITLYNAIYEGTFEKF